MGIDLDFTGLDGIAFKEIEPEAPRSNQTAPEQPAIANSIDIPPQLLQSPTAPTRKPPEALVETPVEGMALVKITRAKEEHEQTSRIYKEYQENIRKSGQLQTEILKGMRAREAPLVLLLKACKAVALMTDNSTFYKTVESNLKSIYGEELLEPAPLEWELKSIRERLENMEKAVALNALDPESDKDSGERLNKAIEAHRKREADIVKLLGIAERIASPI